MLTGIIQFSLSQRLLVLLATFVLLVIGAQALRTISIDAFPEISPTQVKVIIKAPGMTPEEVESLITYPIEVELLGIPNQQMLRSISKYALTVITIDFTQGTDIYWARQQVAERLNSSWESLPQNISGGLAPMSTPLGDLFMFTVDNDSMSLTEKRYLLDWTIRPALRTVDGVADVNALGGFVKTYEVAPINEALVSAQISIDKIIDALRTNNRNDGAGRLTQGEEAILVRVSGAFTSLNDLGNLRIQTGDGSFVALSDLAHIRLGSLERYGSVTENGLHEAVQGLVIGLRGSNARHVVAGIKRKLSELESTLPEGTKLNVFYDRSQLIDRAISNVSGALLQAAALVIAVLILFLGNIRAAITVASILPLTALFTFLLMKQMGLSANLMSLGGLVIAIGLLVDSAIVIVENIVSKQTEHKHNTGNGWNPPQLHVVFRAVKDVATPVTSGVFIIVIVFLPLLTLQGLEGKLFAPVALTIVFALVSALVLSLTVIPVIASFMVRSDTNKEPWIIRQLLKFYLPALSKVLDKPSLAYTVAALLLLLTLVVFPFIGKTFLPTMDEGDIIVQLESIPSISLDANVEIVKRVEAALLAEVPDIERIVSRSGSDEIGMDPMGLNETDIFLQLAPKNQWRSSSKEQIQEQMRKVLDQFHGINYGFTQPIDMRVSEMLTGSRGDIAIKIFGTDLTTLNQLANTISDLVQSIPGAVDTTASVNEGFQYLQIDIDKMKTGQLGISTDTLQDRLRAQMEGLPLGHIIEPQARIPLVLRFDSVTGDGVSQLQNSLVTLNDGRSIALGHLASIKRSEGPVSVSREEGQRFTVVRTNVSNRDLVGFVDEAKALINNQITLPTGYTITWGGQFENQQRAAARLAAVIPVALGLISILLFITFRSIKQTLIILSNIPFALTGGLVALFLTDQYLSVPASVGLIALLGIAVMNAVVMLSHFNHLSAKGWSVQDVVYQGAAHRLRPVLMTATTCALGLVPLLLATGPGSELQKPLAVVVIGGLTSSTLLTLFLLPVIYRRFHRPNPLQTHLTQDSQ